jgi:protein-disulfide isomerase
MPRRNRSRASAEPKSKRASNRWLFIGIIALVAIAAVVAIILTNNNPSQFAGVPYPDRTTMGDPKATVLIEEYSDFQCPYCALFFRENEPKIIEQYIKTGKARLTYIPYSFIGAESISAAEAAYCAADQNKFWDMQYVLFNKQGGENTGVYTTNKLYSYAAEAGLNMQQFRSCFDARTYKQQVQDDLAKGGKAGVTGTPTFFVNGKGPLNSVEVFTQIEAALNTK